MSRETTTDAAERRQLRRVEERVRILGQALTAHAGGLELVRLDRDGEVAVRFSGMCTGCPLRPVTLYGLVKPALLDVEGVNAVSAEGVRVSAEAEARLVDQIQSRGSERLRVALNPEGSESDR